MYSTLFTIALFFNIAISAVFADISVSTPEIFACAGKEVKVTWEAATPPYNLLIVAANDPCGDALVDAGDFQQTFADVKTEKLKVGEKVQISIEDADGEEGWSGVVTVQACPASASGTLTASASAYGVPVPDATTLVVPNPATVGSGASPSVSVKPVGAANAANGILGNSASIPRQISLPAVALTAIAGAVALLL